MVTLTLRSGGAVATAAALPDRLDRRAGGAGAGAVAAGAIGSTCSEVEVCVSNVYLNARLN